MVIEKEGHRVRGSDAGEPIQQTPDARGKSCLNPTNVLGSVENREDDKRQRDGDDK